MNPLIERIALAAAVVALTAMSLGGGTTTAGAQGQTINPADFSTTIDNPLFPLSKLGPKSFVGEETDPDTGEVIEERLESRVVAQAKTVAGVAVVVLEEKAYTDGELVEVAYDYFAQHRNGDVYYFGEDVDNYENGTLKDHSGTWLAGVGTNEPGIIMPAKPVVGQTYEQERAPGVAEDAATVISITETVTGPSGSYTGCLKTRDFNRLDPGVVEFKFHCPGVGLAREEAEDGFLALVTIGPALAAPASPPTAVPPSGGAPVAAAPTPRTGVVAPNTGSGATQSGGSSVHWLMALGAASAGAILVLAGTRHRPSGSSTNRQR